MGRTHPAIQVYKPEIDEALMRGGPLCPGAQKKPMLGICKGNQLLNVLMGGSLYQDLSLKGPDCIRHLQLGRQDYLTHQIRVEEGTRLSKLLGSGVCMTNSMHHQSVKELGRGSGPRHMQMTGSWEAIEDQEGADCRRTVASRKSSGVSPAMNHLFFGSVRQGLGEKSREFIISIENHHRMLTIYRYAG